jgi:anti-anti-sigma factor
MTQVTIRLPSATPHAYLAWVSWWRDVEELLGSDLAKRAASFEAWGGTAETDPALDSIILEHIRLIETEARLALAEGQEEIAPALSAQTNRWDEWLRYGRRRREWLETLALRGLAVPQFPEDLVGLWRDTLRTVQAVVSDHLVLRNLTIVPEAEPGRFRMGGELDVTNVEAARERLERELRDGHRLFLDLSGISFIDSQGLALLVRLAPVAAERNLSPVRVVPSEEVRKVLDVALPVGIPGVEVVADVAGRDGDLSIQ